MSININEPPARARAKIERSSRQTVGALKSDLIAVQARADAGEWPQDAVELAAILVNVRRKLRHLTGVADPVAALELGISTSLTHLVELRPDDLQRFARLYCYLGLTDEGVANAAAAIACLRKLQAEAGPGFIVMDLIADMLPERHVHRWADERFRLAA